MSKEFKKTFDVVYIHWEDAVSGPDIWQCVENIIEWDESTNGEGHHIGIILYETKKHVLFVSDLMPMSTDCSLADTNTFSPFRIPKAWILKRVKLGTIHLEKGFKHK